MSETALVDDEIQDVDIVNEPESKNPQKQHSWTRINTYETCALQYQLVYLKKKKGSVSPIMMIGRVGHDAIKLYNRYCIENKVTSAHEKWEELTWQALENSNLPAEHHPDLFNIVKEYVDSHEVDLESVIGAEEQLAFNRNMEQVEWMADDVWFRLIIDLLQIEGNVCKITDYKLGHAMTSNPFQLKIYAWAIKKLYPQVTNFQIELDYIRHSYQDLTLLTEEDIEDTEKKLFNRIAHIEKAEKFEPNVGVQCSHCPVWYACPVMTRKDIKFKFPNTENEAVEMALELEKVSRLQKELRKVLKEYCDNKGTLEAGGRLYQFKVSVAYEYENIAKLFTELDDIGIDLFEYINVDKRKFNKIAKNEKVIEITKLLGKKKVTVTFSDTKVKKEKE